MSAFEALFREEFTKITASLVRVLGSGQMDLAENIAQETLLKAFRLWLVEGVPENPSAWLRRVAKNEALDTLRRARFVEYDSAALDRWADGVGEAPAEHFDQEIRDDVLRLLFVCCHPELAPDASVALALKTLCGLENAEIARAYLVSEPTVAQRLVRAKQKIRELDLPFEFPAPEQLPARASAVARVLYLLFNEGYFSASEEAVLRQDLCTEALRLAESMAGHPVVGSPSLHALAALFCFHLSRFQSRLDAQGQLVPLEEQDRSRWDAAIIQRGLMHLEASAQGTELSSFHIQAGIAAAHALAPDFAATPWERILDYYDLLVEMEPTPVVRLNRAAALAFARGWEAGLAELDQLAGDPAFRAYPLFAASKADLLRRLGRFPEATLAYREALAQTTNVVEKAFYERRLRECAN